MRRPALIILLTAIACAAIGADYRLSIDAPSGAISKAKAVRIFGLKLGKGDRIVSVGTGKGIAGATRVALDWKPGVGAVVGDVKSKPFSGQIVLAADAVPAKTHAAWIEKIPGTGEEGPGLFSSVLGFVSSVSGLVTIAALAVLGGVFVLFRNGSSGAGPVLPNRRKSIDESLKDIQKRLEKIDERQHELVKKPPVLRSFRRQINDFDSRLASLEGGIRSLQAVLAETGKSLSSLDREQKEMRTRFDSSDAGMRGLAANLEAAKRSIETLSAAIQQVEASQSARIDEVLSENGKRSLESQTKLAALESGITALDKRLDLRPLHSEISDLKTRMDGLASKEVDFSPVESKFEQISQELRSRTSELATQEELGETKVLVEELQGFVGWLRDEQRMLADKVGEVAAREVDLEPLNRAVNELARQMLQISQKEVDLKPLSSSIEALQAKVAQLPTQQTDLEPLSSAFEQLRSEVSTLPKQTVDLTRVESELEAANLAVSKLGDSVAKLGASTADELSEVKKHQSSLRDEVNALHEAIASGGEEGKLDLVSSAVQELSSETAKLSGEYKHQRDSLQSCLVELEQLRASLTELGARTDQRESLLLQLQSRAAESDAGNSAGADILPLVADLRLELQSLAADQEKVGAALTDLSQKISESQQESGLAQRLNELAESVNSLRSSESAPSGDLSTILETLRTQQDETSSLREEIKSLGERMVQSNSEATTAGATIDVSRMEAELKALADHITNAKPSQTESTLDTSGIREEIAALQDSIAGLATPGTGLDDLRARLEEVSKAVADWSAPVYDDSELRAELRSLAQLLTENANSGLQGLSKALEDWKADAEKRHDELAQEVVRLSHLPVPESVVTRSPEPPRAAEESAPAVRAESVDNTSGTSHASHEEPRVSGWAVPGGSARREWSAHSDAPVTVSASEKPLTAMTPTVTPATEYAVGPLLYIGKKVIYGHGTCLRSTWPGKSPSAAQLQEKLEPEPWRLASLDGHVFCVEDGQVEVVSLSTWNVVARFSGDFVDQTCTSTHWVGLGSALGRLYLDNRNLQGRLLGEPVQLPIQAEDGRGLVTDGERIFVGSSKGKIFKVELGKVHEFAALDSEVVSMSATRAGLLALIRRQDGDALHLLNFEGKPSHELHLDFKHGFGHPVVMGDRVYVVNSEAGEVSVLALNSLERLGSVAVPNGEVLSFSGVHHGENHALLVAVSEGAAGKVLLLDPATGNTQNVCDIAQKQIDVISAEGRIVVATSCSYQNMIRIFQPFASESLRRAV